MFLENDDEHPDAKVLVGIKWVWLFFTIQVAETTDIYMICTQKGPRKLGWHPFYFNSHVIEGY